MIESITTPEFFAMQIINLSRGETFGIHVRFGLDYNIQGQSLDLVPNTLKSVVQQSLRDLGQKQAAETLVVELEHANDSSLDYLVFARIPSKHAKEYLELSRAITQSCVKACNENGWSIPFPQMVMHQAN